MGDERFYQWGLAVKLSLLPICASGRHCQTCRDLEGGRQWRIDLAMVRMVPDDAPDFTCPRGVEWGYIAPPLPERPALPVAEFTDEEIEEERRRLAAGGCCGEPSKQPE